MGQSRPSRTAHRKSQKYPFVKLPNLFFFKHLGDLIEVKWADAQAVDGWIHYDEMRENGLIQVKNAGYLLDFTETHLKLASGITSGGAIATLFIIPRSNILKIRAFKPVVITNDEI